MTVYKYTANTGSLKDLTSRRNNKMYIKFTSNNDHIRTSSSVFFSVDKLNIDRDKLHRDPTTFEFNTNISYTGIPYLCVVLMLMPVKVQ